MTTATLNELFYKKSKEFPMDFKDIVSNKKY